MNNINIEELLQTCTRFSTEEEGIVLVCHDDEHGVIDVCAKPENDNEYVIEWARYCDGDRWYEIPSLAGQVFPANVFVELVKRFTPKDELSALDVFIPTRNISMLGAMKKDALYVAIEAAEGDYVRFTVKLDTRFSEEQFRNDWRGDLWQLAYYRLRCGLGRHDVLKAMSSVRGLEFDVDDELDSIEISPDNFLNILRKWGTGGKKESCANQLFQTIYECEGETDWWMNSGLQGWEYNTERPGKLEQYAWAELCLMFPEWANKYKEWLIKTH